MESDVIKSKFKNWFLEILLRYKKPIFIVFLIILSFILLIYAFNSYGKNYVVDIINTLIKSQIEMIDQNYNTQIKIRDDQIRDLQERISASEKISANIKKRVNDVELRIKERKEPVTSNELRDRSTALGFKPVN